MIIINFKNYRQGTEVLKLAKKIQKQYPNAIIAVPAPYLSETSSKIKLDVFAQHIDSIIGKKSTGFVTSESVRKAGVKGSLLNHSEHQIEFDRIKQTIKNSSGLKIIVCTSSLKQVKNIKKLKPYGIAYEEPGLIATRKSITRYKRQNIIKFVALLKNTSIIPICGAGITSKEDIDEAEKLGCKGVLIASAVADSKNPEILK
jgi:triosephosphate isomerase